MHRTQLLIEPWQHEQLASLAKKEGRSISSLVREILTRYFEQQQARKSSRLREIEGIAEGPPDLGRGHDGYLYGNSREE